MGSMNATGWALCVCASAPADELFDFACELCDRLGGGGAPTIHALNLERAEGERRRYCFHPSGARGFEVRGDDLRKVLQEGVMMLSQQLDPHDLWRRD